MVQATKGAAGLVDDVVEQAVEIVSRGSVDAIFIDRATASRLGADGKVIWVHENSSMSIAARNYDDTATGSRYSIDTKSPLAPAVVRIDRDGNSTFVRFDGVDSGILVDRKLAVLTTQKAKDQIMRQSDALQQNSLAGRWEVPSQYQADRAIRMFKELGVSNIEVRVVPK